MKELKEELIKFAGYIYENWKLIERIYPEPDKLIEMYLNSNKEPIKLEVIEECIEWMHKARVENNDDIFCPICGKKLQ